MPEEPLSPDERAELVKRKLDEHRTWVETRGEGGNRLVATGEDLSGLDLSGANLYEANLAGAKLYDVNLSGAVLTEADLSKANLSEANLSEAVLSGANLSNADLSEANLTGASLSGAKFLGANLSGADMYRADLHMADLSGADLYVANLTEAKMFRAKLTGAFLLQANLSGASLFEADLSGADLSCTVLSAADIYRARLDNALLHDARGLRLDFTFVRGAQFSPQGSGWWALLANRVLPRLRQWSTRRKWRWMFRWLNFSERHRDPWSVLRQTYAGPRAFYLFFLVVLFALPYVGRAMFYSAVGPVEQRLMERVDARKRELRQELETGPLAGDTIQVVRVKVPHETVSLTIEGKSASVVLPGKDIELPLSIRDNRQAVAKRELAALEAIERRVEPRPLWQVVLRWDEGRMLPTALAILLVGYNVGLYWLVTTVGPLRDEEERSGWAPKWVDYRWLVWLHWVVTALFYVSVFSFARNVAQALEHPVRVWLPAGGG